MVKEQYALCRCGASANKPFCDGTHQKSGFNGTETASREPYDQQAKVVDGSGMVLQDAEALCAFARFCDNAGSIWRLIEQTKDVEVRKIAFNEATHCPSRRLVVRDKESNEIIEPAIKPSISLVEGPTEKCSGPIWVRGWHACQASDEASYEVLNRVTFCRCGGSENNPSATVSMLRLNCWMSSDTK